MGLSDNGGYRSHKIAVSLGKDDDKPSLVEKTNMKL